MSLFPDTQQWLNWMGLTSVPLKKLSDTKTPIGIASGCLIDYKGKRFLLTVSHAVDMKNTDWMMEIAYDPHKGTEVFRPNHFLHLGEIVASSGQLRDVDYAYTEIPSDIQPYFQLVGPRGLISEKIKRHVFVGTDISEPSTDAIYAFSGQVFPELHGSSALVTQPTVYPGLKYISSDGSFHIFKLPVKHPGHESFQGCSGAPIVDMDGKVVALVCRGCEKEDTILGVSVARYKFALDFYVRAS